MRRLLVPMALVVLLAGVATPAWAGSTNASGFFPNGVAYNIQIDVTGGYAQGSAGTSSNYSQATLVVYQCSGTGDCSARVKIASNRNYNTSGIATGNPYSFGHTYQTCLSATFGTTSYSNYCTGVAANS